MIITLDSLQLPKYGELKEVTTPNVAENITLSGSMYVDYRHYRRTWVISWGLMSATDYDLIRTKFNAQFSSNTPLLLTIDTYGISEYVYVKLNDKDIKYNAGWIEGVTLTLEEIDAIS